MVYQTIELSSSFNSGASSFTLRSIFVPEVFNYCYFFLLPYAARFVIFRWIAAPGDITFPVGAGPVALCRRVALIINELISLHRLIFLRHLGKGSPDKDTAAMVWRALQF